MRCRGFGSVWQCGVCHKQSFPRHHRRMTSEQTLRGSWKAGDAAWWSIVADLAFWSVAGASGAALSERLENWWGIPHGVLLAVGLAFLVGGAGLLFALNRVRTTSCRLVWGFGVFNLVFAPLAWAAALSGWLGLSRAGDWALGWAGGIALALGIWQLNALRRSQRAHQ
jgi:hypothetical protein